MRGRGSGRGTRDPNVLSVPAHCLTARPVLSGPSRPAARSSPLPELSVPRRPQWDPDFGCCFRRSGSGDARRVLSGPGVPVPLSPVSRPEGGLWHWLGTAVLRTSHFILGANGFLFTSVNPFEQRGNCFRLYIADSFKIQY